MQKLKAVMALALVYFAASTPAHAYMGPGAGVGAFAVVIGMLGSVLLGIVALFWYPLKRLMRRIRQAKTGRNPAPVK